MRQNIWSTFSQIAGAISLFAGVLAVANVEVPQPIKRNLSSENSPLTRILDEDEIGDENPYAHLSPNAPLQTILQKSITKFHRETYRSAEYQGEVGYDLVHYQIENSDGTTSTILAYLENVKGSEALQNVGSPDQRTAFVALITANKYMLFKRGILIEQSNLTAAEADSLISRRLSAGVPFLSIER